MLELKRFVLGNVGPLLAFVSALATLSITPVIALLQDRRRLVMRERLLNEASSRAAFWRDWLAGIRTRRMPRAEEVERCDRKLQRCATVVEALFLHWPKPALWTPLAYGQYLSEIPYWRRLTLLYEQRNKKADNRRFYVYAPLIAFVLMGQSYFRNLSELERHASEPHPRIYLHRNNTGAPSSKSPDGKVDLRTEVWYEHGELVACAFTILGARLFLHLREYAWLSGSSRR